MIVGRFAPSPTGALHRGSLVAAIASYCDAKHQQGDWWLRIDDIDPPREDRDASERILTALSRFGFKADRIIYQSNNLSTYEQALRSLNQQKLLYPCYCTRKTLQGRLGCQAQCSLDPPAALNLSEGISQYKNEASLRCRIESLPTWTDLIQSSAAMQQHDPVVWRKDGLVSYALACAIDDSESVTHVVRGSDLLESTSVQIALMHALDRPPPIYAHVPVAINKHNQKLSKQNQAEPIDDMPILSTLQALWQFLGQTVVATDDLEKFWADAIANWSCIDVPKVRELPDPVSPSLAQN